MSTSDNAAIIKAAAEAIRERAPSDDRPRVWAPAGWRELDIEYPSGQRVVRLRPADGDAVDVEIFRWGALVAGEHLGRYRGAAALAALVEDVLRRAIT
jgi:hypothetical protein